MSAEMKALGAPPIIETFAINPVGDGDICVDRGNRFAHERDVAKLHAWAKEAADAIERLARERDEALAPVAWLYFNEDAGNEIAYVHPTNSGEVPDATDIRPIRDRAAVECIRDAWDHLRSERAEAHAALAAAQAENARLREATTATIAAIAQLQHAFGAPGDYGYNTPRGDALFALYRAQYSLDGGRADDH